MTNSSQDLDNLIDWFCEKTFLPKPITDEDKLKVLTRMSNCGVVEEKEVKKFEKEMKENR